jgi:hypothetical protein
VTQQTMKMNDTEISEDGQRELLVDDLKEAAQRNLAAGVLKQAAQDLRRFQGGMSKIERDLYFDAYRWVTVDECSSPFSFLRICQLLNLVPEDVRQELIGEVSGVRLFERTMLRKGLPARAMAIAIDAGASLQPAFATVNH